MLTFKKEERLTSRKLILELVKNGSSFLLYPFRLSSLPTELPTANYPAQLLISVSRRRFRTAAGRNRVKRLIREAYRKNKAQYLYEFLENRNITLALMIAYVGNDILPAAEIEKKLILALKRLQREHDQESA